MNVLKQLIRVLSILATLTATHWSPAAADPAKKVLALSVGPSEWYFKNVPRLSLRNGPLMGDEASVGVEIDRKALVEFLANYKAVEQAGGFYREARNFRDSRAELKVKQVDGTVATTTFSLAPNAPSNGVLELSEFFLGVDADVTGIVDIYKCFDANTCVFEATTPKRLFGEGGPSAKHNFRPLVDCRSDNYFIRVQGGTAHPEIQRIILHRTVARRILRVAELITAKSKPVLTGAEFAGFTTNIGEFGLYQGQAPGTTLEVNREGNSLSVVTRHPDGKLRSSFTFRVCANHPEPARP